MSRYRLLPLVLALCAACSGDTSSSASRATTASPSTTPTLPAGLTPLAAAQLDSGNVAFRLKQYAPALAYYEHAASTVPNHPAPWYGISMVAQAMGNTALADSALAQVATRSGGTELLDQSVSQSHGQTGSTTAGAGTTTSTAVSGTSSSGSTPARHPVLGPPR